MRTSFRHRVKWVTVAMILGAVVAGAPRAASADQVILDDLIVDGSICVGFDCVNGESFGFDTLRLKENNLRIRAVDTSTSASFPSNDWQITFNDTSNGGANKFSIDDLDGGRTPFTIEAGAPNNSLYVDDGGRIGLGTSTPVVEVHIKDGDTPTLRLEQDGSSGFTPQTWDVAGNETNFFVRDVTNSSKLSFRIRPSAPSNSIFVDTDGGIGLGTSSPDGKLHADLAGNSLFLVQDDGTLQVVVESVSVTPIVPSAQTVATFQRDGDAVVSIISSDTNRSVLFFGDTTSAVSGRIDYNNSNDSMNFRTNGTDNRIVIESDGDVGFGTDTPTGDFHVVQGATGSSLVAGNTTFTATSSRTLKENIRPVQADDILEKVAKVSVMTYDWKPEVWNGNEEERKDKLGLIAEDFHTVLGRGSDKTINGQDVEMTLWLAVQKLHEENQELKGRLSQLEQQVQTEDKR